MSGPTKFTSITLLLISCTLPFSTTAQPLAGSFPESTAAQSPFFQQACPPDFPMPDIWERPGAGPIDLPSFAPVWLKSSFGWNRPLMFGSVPAEIVSGRFRQRAEAATRIPVSQMGRPACSAGFSPQAPRTKSLLMGNEHCSTLPFWGYGLKPALHREAAGLTTAENQS